MSQRSYLESDLFWHTFSLVSQNNRITITTSFLACMLPQLKLLQDRNLLFSLIFNSLSENKNTHTHTQGLCTVYMLIQHVFNQSGL